MVKRDESRIAESLRLESAIIEDLRRRTGLSYRKLGSIELSNPSVAAAVLPVLRDWLPRAGHLANMRAAIFSLFATPNAKEHFEWLQENWEREEDRIARGDLSYALAATVDDAHAEQLWKRVVELNRTSDFRLLASLARFPEIKRPVVSALLQEMDSPDLKPFELRPVADLDDPAILQWFRAHAVSVDKDLRRLAKQVVGRRGKLPSGARYSAEGPDRRLEVFSAEVDVDGLPELLRTVSERFECQPRIEAKRFSFAGRMELNRWARVEPPLNAVPGVFVWLRLEDFDALEIVLTRA